jgi:hypothetical protein
VSILANYSGQGYVALIGLVSVPFLLARLGEEGYGVIGCSPQNPPEIKTPISFHSQ